MQTSQHPRASQAALGDLAFTYRQDTDDLQFGNIEEITVTGFRVSFEQAGWERRGEAIEIAFDDVILASELNGQQPGAGYLYKANEAILRTTGTRTAEVLTPIASQEDPGHPLLVARVVFRASTGWIASGDPFTVQANDIYHPRTLNSLQKYRFCSPVHPLFDVLRLPAGLDIDKKEPATLRLPNAPLDIPVNAHIRVVGHVVSVEVESAYAIARLLGGVRSEYLDNEQLLPRNPTSHWEGLVAVDGTTHRSESGVGFSGSISVIPRSFEFMHATKAVAATTETYVGAPYRAWSHRVWFREEPVNQILLPLGAHPPNAVFFSCLGAPAILATAFRHGDDPVEYLSVTRLGNPLADDDHAVLSAFIGFITGGRATNVITETFYLTEKVKTIIHDRGEPTKRKQPPIPVMNAWSRSDIVTSHFSTMLSELKRLRGVDSRSFDAVFHHYAEGVDSNYPVTRTLRLAIALEAFINLVTQDKAENEKIVGNAEYEPLRDLLISTVENYAAEHPEAVSEIAKNRFTSKLFQGFNSGSNTKRINRFWELVPITLDDSDERFIRKLRNQSTHQGFLGEANEEQDALGDAEAADRLCDIVNRAILHYIKYTGPVLSAKNGSWIDAQTGQTYRVQSIPHGGTLHIDHRVTMPALTEEEQAVKDRLEEMQRPPDPAHPFIVEDALVPENVE